MKNNKIEITLLGTGAAYPDAERSAPAFLVNFEDTPYLIDCGGGTPHQLMKAGVPTSTLKNIFFTHMHIDHCVEFPSLVFGSYLNGKEGNFNVYGPKGTKHFTDSIFNDTYNFARPMMQKIRNKDIEINTKEIDKGIIFENDALKVESAPVEHGIATNAYKFTVENKSVVFSGDTSPCDSIIELSKDVDLLIIECSFPEDFGKYYGHCVPSEVAEIATKANTKEVVLMHLFPMCSGREEEIINDIKKGYSGKVSIGNDLQKIIL